MIRQYYWKDKLGELSSRIEELVNLKNTNDEKIYEEIELSIISGWFIIRRLKEHYKLTDKFVSKVIKKGCYKYSFIQGKEITPLNNHRLDEFYNFNKKEYSEFKLKFLYNSFIHSYYFIINIDLLDNYGNSVENVDDSEIEKYDKKYTSIYFTSDYNKEKYIYEIEIEEIIKIFREVSNMDITSIRYQKGKKGKWIIETSDEIKPLPEEIKKMIEEKDELPKIQQILHKVEKLWWDFSLKIRNVFLGRL